MNFGNPNKRGVTDPTGLTKLNLYKLTSFFN